MIHLRWVPVPKDIDDEDTGPLWKCVGCGLQRKDPSPRLGDDCPAESLPL